MISQTPDGVQIDIRVIPRARKTQISGERGGALVIRVAAPPVDGAANDAVIEFLAKALSVPRRAIRIVAGERTPIKRIAVDGVALDGVRALLRATR